MITRFLLLQFFLYLSTSVVYTQIKSPQLESILDKVNAEYQANNAYETTKYVANFWRSPGNAGFDASIYKVQEILEKAGYQKEGVSPNQILTYRIESYPMRRPAWEPVSASLSFSDNTPILDFSTNRNMIAINSFPTPAKGIEAEVIYLENCTPEAVKDLDLQGKVVMADCHPYPLFKLAVEQKGAIGILSYLVPSYNQPQKYSDAIPFRSIPFNSEFKSWCIALSTKARNDIFQALQLGPLQLKVNVQTKLYPSEELSIIAEVKGQKSGEERFVFSAHVQEPGANDNASGVGAQAEMARVAAQLVNNGVIQPDRTITFLWGDEIISTRRYIQQDSIRANGIKWGMSLDMVGEDTEKTGGTFLIEKMPDPSAIWTRGADKHTEWGATPVKEENFNPHYFNDFINYVCKRQANRTGWIVNTNPYEGGSDHQPFLDAKIPGLLMWHFTDVFYHTDADRIDKVSPQTLKNVGVSALSSALMLCNSTEATAMEVLEITQTAASKRIKAETQLAIQNIAEGKAKKDEEKILKAWEQWYTRAIPKVSDILIDNASSKLEAMIKKATKKTQKLTTSALKKWK